MLYATVLRSPHAAAKISSISIEKAVAVAGVRAVYTGEDVKDVGPVPCAGSMPTLRVPHHHILAQDRVYYVGHPVAAVVATDRYVAQDAVDLIEVNYESADNVADPEKALEEGSVRVEATGKVTIMSGASPHGQDGETAYAQMAADHLGIPMDDIVVIHGDTAKVHFGVGTFGSRGMAIGGTAVHLALEDIVSKASKYAAHMTGVSADSITFDNGVFSSSETEKTLTFQDLALEAALAQNLPPGAEPGISATRFFEPANFAFPFGAHIATVEIDRDTGQVKILRYIAVDDIGNVINPMLADGQLHGGGAQGLGPAFLEEVV